MSDPKRCTVLNTKDFGGIDKLPDTAIYVGRPSLYGNPYSMESNKYTREEVIALHRIDLYQSYIDNPALYLQMQSDLKDKDLACWCAKDNQVVGCHADTYLHLLSYPFSSRIYDGRVIQYLMEDVRSALTGLDLYARTLCPVERYLDVFILLGDVRTDIQYALQLAKLNHASSRSIEVFASLVAIDLELAVRDPDVDMKLFRMEHTSWLCDRFITNRTDRFREPVAPSLASLKRKSTRG